MAKMPKYYKIHTDGCTVELEPIYEELAPVVHGRWERNIVIKCGLKHHEGFNASCCGRWSKCRTLYCPNCGAKMDGDGKI